MMCFQYIVNNSGEHIVALSALLLISMLPMWKRWRKFLGYTQCILALCLLCIVALSTWCQKTTQSSLSFTSPEIRPEFEFRGDIDYKFVDFLKTVPEGTSVSLTSRGGFDAAAFAASRLMSEKRLSLDVRGYCLSACADIIIPSASKVILRDFPIIGMHGNPATAYLKAHLVQPTMTQDQLETCAWFANEVKALWSSSADGTRLVDSYDTVLVPLSATAGKSCPRVKYQHLYRLWSGDELRELFGLRIIGQTCADSKECIENSLSTKWPGATLVLQKRLISLKR